MTEQQVRPAQAVVVGPDEGRELPLIGRVALSGAQTGGAFELIDFRGNRERRRPRTDPRHARRPGRLLR